MNPKRKQRLYLTVFLLMVSAGVTGLLILVSGENMNMFYPPADVVAGKIPPDQKVRAGGMVLDGSVQRSDTSLAVDFQLTDHQGAVFAVAYAGILPDLFREGQGILVEGKMDAQGVFQAEEVLAKHDENYMPPELLDMDMQTGSQSNKPTSSIDPRATKGDSL